MNCITVVCLFVIMVWLMNDAPDSLIADIPDKIVYVTVVNVHLS